MLEAEIELLFEAFEALVDDKLASDAGRDGLSETIRARKLKDDVIKVICFGEKLD